MGFWNRWFNKTPAETRINTELVTKRGVSKYIFSGVAGEIDVVRAASDLLPRRRENWKGGI